MANVIQAATAPVDLRPFTTLPRGRDRYPAEPIAMLQHYESELELDAVLDTGGLQLTLPLTNNFAYRLYSATAFLHRAGDVDVDFESMVIKTFFTSRPSIAPPSSVELVIPFTNAIFEDVTNMRVKAYELGGLPVALSPVAVNSPLQGYNQVIYGTTAWNPILELTMTGITTTHKLNYLVCWLQYNIEDTIGSDLYWEVPTRS